MPTYYVDGAVCNDGNLGTSEGAGNAWATIDHAMNSVASGDHVYIKASAAYTETPNIDTPGNSSNIVVIEGYTTTPGDDGKATIDGESTRSYCLTGSTAATYYIWKNTKFINATSHGAFIAAQDVMQFVNCEFNNNGASGLFGDNSIAFINCVATGNATRGIDIDSGNVVGCIFHTNGQEQYYNVGSGMFYKNLIYGQTNTADAAVYFAGATNIIGNTIDGENIANYGISAALMGNGIVLDNILHDCDAGFLPQVNDCVHHHLLHHRA